METFNFFGTEIKYEENSYSDEEIFARLYKHYSKNKVENKDKIGKLCVSFMLPIKDWKSSYLGLCCLPASFQIVEITIGAAHVTVWYNEDETNMVNNAISHITKGHFSGLHLYQS